MLQNRVVNRAEPLKWHDNPRPRHPAKTIRHMSWREGKSDDWCRSDCVETNGDRIVCGFADMVAGPGATRLHSPTEAD